MHSNATPSRRRFLQQAGGLAGTVLGPLGLNLAAMCEASAATSPGYKALVCVYLYGGNDAYNTVLATDAASWAAYNAVRAGDGNTQGIALPAPGTPPSNDPNASFNARLGGVLPIQPANPQGRSLAVHPVLGGVQSLFGSGRLAVLANVGPLMGPTTKAAYLGGKAALPPKLFSHNDQQSVWQSMAGEGSTRGWGGKMADQLLAGNGGSMFTALSVSNEAVWLSGDQVRQFQLAPTGVLQIGSPTGILFNSAQAQATLVSLMTSTRSNNIIEQDHAAIVVRAKLAQDVLTGVMPAADAGPWGTGGLAQGQPDPKLQYKDPASGLLQPNPLAQQLQAVARMMASSAALGVKRQIFFVSLNGLDTHSCQSAHHASALARLDQGLTYFDTVTQAMGVAQSVTTFTASDFGRAFNSNGDGTDHGWGGHHFILGGAVKGGDVYGRFPVYGSPDGMGGFTSDDQLDVGALLPAVSVDQYASTLGRWLGLSSAQLMGILPALAQWPASDRDLGFLR